VERHSELNPLDDETCYEACDSAVKPPFAQRSDTRSPISKPLVSGEPAPIVQLIGPTVIEPPPSAAIVPIPADRLCVVVPPVAVLVLVVTEAELETDELELEVDELEPGVDAPWARTIAVSKPFRHVTRAWSPTRKPRRIPEAATSILQATSFCP